jgi:hypothetical protein
LTREGSLEIRPSGINGATGKKMTVLAQFGAVLALFGLA